MQNDDVGMHQRGGRAGFLQEPPFAAGVGELVPRQDLDSYDTVQARVAGAINLAHAARADLRENLVGTEPLSRRHVS